MKQYSSGTKLGNGEVVVIRELDRVKREIKVHERRDYSPLDAKVTAEWLNDRAAGYPPKPLK